jgi:hypothetical protein
VRPPSRATKEERIVLRKILALESVALGFTALTLWGIHVHGYVGFFEALLGSAAGIVAFTDLVIALSLVLFWMWDDAHARALPFWPYALVTLALGSLGPLSYLVHREVRARVPRAGAFERQPA